MRSDFPWRRGRMKSLGEKKIEPQQSPIGSCCGPWDTPIHLLFRDGLSARLRGTGKAEMLPPPPAVSVPDPAEGWSSARESCIANRFRSSADGWL